MNIERRETHGDVTLSLRLRLLFSLFFRFFLTPLCIAAESLSFSFSARTEACFYRVKGIELAANFWGKFQFCAQLSSTSSLGLIVFDYLLVILLLFNLDLIQVYYYQTKFSSKTILL